MFEEFKGKKIAILGFGVEGKATFEYLRKSGFKPSIIDRKTREDFLDENKNLKDYPDLLLGDDYLSYLNGFDYIFKTPGISPLLPQIVAAERSGVNFTSQIEEFFKYCPCEIIGVTGTKGKGTTSNLIYQILKKAGKDVYLGGNIGVPAITFLDDLTEKSVVVLELSSFQLQVLKQSPHIAVVLMVTVEHLDYHSDIQEYREAKQSIVKFQTPDDFAVVNSDYEGSLKVAEVTKGKKYFVSKKEETNGCYVDESDNVIVVTKKGKEEIINFKEMPLRGRHNLENITAASMAGYLAGISLENIRYAIKNYRGLEHRLEFVKEVHGVKYYNDSFSTVPETSIAAIEAFDEDKIIILGGSYKGSDYTELGKKIAESNVKAVILIGEMAEEIEKAIPKTFRGKKIKGLKTMEEFVEKAAELSQRGDVVLLSPACASFGLFTNYKDRGNQFKEQVNKLK